MLHYNKELKHLSRVLRKNMTDSERLLWSRIRRKQLKGKQFYRQKIIGNYIVDFFCPSARIIVQVDGGQHYEQAGRKADNTQDRQMRRRGLRVIRFSSYEVLSNTDGVVSEIMGYL